MKYNKSEIMKNAWRIVRQCKCTISVALKRAWEKAKEDLKLAKLGKYSMLSLMDAKFFLTLETELFPVMHFIVEKH